VVESLIHLQYLLARYPFMEMLLNWAARDFTYIKFIQWEFSLIMKYNSIEKYKLAKMNSIQIDFFECSLQWSVFD